MLNTKGSQGTKSCLVSALKGISLKPGCLQEQLNVQAFQVGESLGRRFPCVRPEGRAHPGCSPAAQEHKVQVCVQSRERTELWQPAYQLSPNGLQICPNLNVKCQIVLVIELFQHFFLMSGILDLKSPVMPRREELAVSQCQNNLMTLPLAAA